MIAALEQSWKSLVRSQESLSLVVPKVVIDSDGIAYFQLDRTTVLIIEKRQSDCRVSYEDWSGQTKREISQPCKVGAIGDALQVVGPSVLQDISSNFTKTFNEEND